MSKSKLFASLLLPFFISNCMTPGSRIYPEVSIDSPYPMASPSAAATSAPASDLGNLNAGLLPDTSLTDEEKKLAGVLVRKVSPEFPLKVGVILYSRYVSIEDKYRKNLYNEFLAKLKQNENIKQVLDISPNLLTGGSSIEDLRKLAAKFQVSTLLIIGDSYQAPQVNKDAYVTPIDYITGMKTWESMVSLNAYGLDTFNGVFVFSAGSDVRLSDKYNNEDPVKNKDNILIKDAASKAWTALDSKVGAEINDYKNRITSQNAAAQPAAQ
jgi:hypothetical protein